MGKSEPLSNFNLPPELTWGRQRLLRCRNINPIRAMPAVDDGESSDSGEYNDNRHAYRRSEPEFERLRVGKSIDDQPRTKLNSSPPSPEIGDEDEISATREKLMKEYRTEIGKMQKLIPKHNNSIDREREREPNSPPLNSKSKQKLTFNTSPPPPPPPSSAIFTSNKRSNAEVDDPRSEKKSARPRRNLEKKEERPKFSISLSRKEIEEDFIAVTGKKPPRKPNKRPKSVQADLNAIFPGSWLSEIHPDRYKVKEIGKE